MEPRKLRIGVIGAGKFAEVCHVAGLQSHPHVAVVALWGRSLEKARAMAERCSIPNVHTDYRELCRRDDIDAVTIATPNVEHAAQACAAFAAGKHVFCEKPLGMTVQQAREMMRAAEMSRRVHQVAFTYRYLYGVQELRRRLRQGDVGAPYFLRIHYECWDGMEQDYKIGFREKIDLAGGGMLYDMGSHMFDLASYIVGPIEALTGYCDTIPRQRIDSRTGQPAKVETDDIVGIFCMHEKGVRSQLFTSRVTPTPPHGERGYVEVVGTEGALKASLSRGSVDVLKAASPSRPQWQNIPLDPKAQEGKPHCLGRMMRSFADACLRGKLDGMMDASFHDGLAAQQGLAAVDEASKQMTWVQFREGT